MVDISKCSGERELTHSNAVPEICPLRDSCYRYTAITDNLGYQSWMKPEFEDKYCVWYEEVEQ